MTFSYQIIRSDRKTMLLRTGFSPGLLIETFFDIRWALFP